MPGRLKSTLHFKNHSNHFSANVSVVGKLIERDGKKIFVGGPKRSLTFKKDALHITAATNFFKILRKIEFKRVRIVPVKTDSVNKVQKYFHRPSLASFEEYLAFKLKYKPVLRRFVTKTDIAYCNALINKFPNISLEKWHKMVFNAKNELMYKANVGEPIDLIPESNYLWKFHFNNFIVFGTDRAGIIKVGLIDV